MDESFPRALLRRLPIVLIALVALSGAIWLRDLFSFETLRDNRARLIGWRDAHYLLTALAFVGAYVVLVAFSLPGATVATLTGGFLFGVFPGVLYNVVAATLGAVAGGGCGVGGARFSYTIRAKCGVRAARQSRKPRP